MYKVFVAVLLLFAVVPSLAMAQDEAARTGEFGSFRLIGTPALDSIMALSASYIDPGVFRLECLGPEGRVGVVVPNAVGKELAGFRFRIGAYPADPAQSVIYQVRVVDAPNPDEVEVVVLQARELLSDILLYGGPVRIEAETEDEETTHYYFEVQGLSALLDVMPCELR